MAKKTEINLSESQDGRKKSLPKSLLRGKYDSGAQIIRKIRPSTTKNSNSIDFKKTFEQKNSVSLIGTSFTGRKDFIE